MRILACRTIPPTAVAALLLLLLQAQGLSLIKLRANTGLAASPLDIVDNPKKLKMVAIDADTAQLPRSLDDLDAVAINGTYAESAGLDPVRDAIAMESAKESYVNVSAVGAADRNQPWVAKLVKEYHSQEIKKFIKDKYKEVGSMVLVTPGRCLRSVSWPPDYRDIPDPPARLHRLCRCGIADQLHAVLRIPPPTRRGFPEFPG